MDALLTPPGNVECDSLTPALVAGRSAMKPPGNVVRDSLTPALAAGIKTADGTAKYVEPDQEVFMIPEIESDNVKVTAPIALGPQLG